MEKSPNPSPRQNTGVEAGVEDADVEVQAAMTERTDERVDPQARADGVDVDGAGGHEPQHGERRRAEPGVEKVEGVCVALATRMRRERIRIGGDGNKQ